MLQEESLIILFITPIYFYIIISTVSHHNCQHISDSNQSIFHNVLIQKSQKLNS